MGLSNRRNIKANFDKVEFDKKMGQFLDVGRQFVDGVSGTRPGQRKASNFKEFSRRNANNVRQWVNNRVDSFFDDEYDDDWDYQDDSQDFKSFNREKKTDQSINKFTKRPLEALSLRETEDNQSSKIKQLPYSQQIKEEEWPDDSDFQVSRWKRSETEDKAIRSNEGFHEESLRSRNLPKSRRRRI
tara:strand:+ start:378 stop:935 length:558 start_codon:yes stop_codon:yes gene_type:complete